MVQERLAEKCLDEALAQNLAEFAQWRQKVQSEKGLRLGLKNGDLGIFVPPRLLKWVLYPSEVEIVRLDTMLELGSRDEHRASLFILIVEREAFCLNVLRQEDDERGYERAFNNSRVEAMRSGKLSLKDKVLIKLIADDSWSPQGVEVESLIIAESLRGRGVGNDFYERFEAIVKILGFKYMWGENSFENLQFFLRRGRYSVNQLNPESPPARWLVPFDFKLGELATIKFFDKALERACVQPQFLRNGQ